MSHFASSREGVVKYRLQFTLAQPPSWEGYPDLNAWRKILFRLRLIGQDRRLYGGLGYGNVSERVANGFVISATQTGGREHLLPEDYALVIEADPSANLIVAAGVSHPSSEALTHAAVYRASSKVKVVLHGHCQEIWKMAGALDLPMTPRGIDYGTPAMAEAVSEWVRRKPESDVVVMGGHRDGILAYGVSADQAGGLMVAVLARAWRLCEQDPAGHL